eukprot:6615981-Ditylum_brightwellii.AAC.1
MADLCRIALQHLYALSTLRSKNEALRQLIQTLSPHPNALLQLQVPATANSPQTEIPHQQTVAPTTHIPAQKTHPEEDAISLSSTSAQLPSMPLALLSQADPLLNIQVAALMHA